VPEMARESALVCDLKQVVAHLVELSWAVMSVRSQERVWELLATVVKQVSGQGGLEQA